MAAKAALLPRTSLGEFPIDLAKEGNHKDVESFLESYKISPATTFKSQWYHGTLTREEAVEVLKKYVEDMHKNNFFQNSFEYASNSGENNCDTSGCFLVRVSERKSAGSGYVLTLLFDNVAKNFIISQSVSIT